MGSSALPPQLFASSLTNEYGAGLRAVLNNGMKVVTDANVTTTAGAGTEDEAYCVAADECHLWEDPNAPQFIRAEQPKAANLAVLIVLYGYVAYSFRRYSNAIAKVNGTGMIAPSF
jgi:hypothetical protein